MAGRHPALRRHDLPAEEASAEAYGPDRVEGARSHARPNLSLLPEYPRACRSYVPRRAIPC
jgi:hypothetical protein